MLIGEAPGAEEDRQGKPFVGPSGQLLDRMLAAIGLDRTAVWITNIVFWRPPGNRPPTAGEIDTCRWWLDAERGLVKPRLVLALGASAARGVLGKSVGVQKARGEALALPEGELWVSTHPSYLLRLRDEGRRTEEARFAADLAAVAERLEAVDR